MSRFGPSIENLTLTNLRKDQHIELRQVLFFINKKQADKLIFGCIFRNVIPTDDNLTHLNQSAFLVAPDDDPLTKNHNISCDSPKFELPKNPYNKPKKSKPAKLLLTSSFLSNVQHYKK